MIQRSWTKIFLAALFSVLVVGAVGASSHQYEGTWDNIDLFDGSSQVFEAKRVGAPACDRLLSSGRQPCYRISYVDFGASVCGWVPGGPDVLFRARGFAYVDASSGKLIGQTRSGCVHGDPVITDFAPIFAYNAADDTLTLENDGNIWIRR